MAYDFDAGSQEPCLLRDQRGDRAVSAGPPPAETFDDLGVGRVIAVICAGRNDADVLRSMLGKPCATVEDVRSRQRVWRDYDTPAISGILDDFVAAVARMRAAIARQTSERDDTYRYFMRLQSITAFVHGIDGVVQRIANVRSCCEEVRGVLSAITRFSDTREYLAMREQAESIARELFALRFRLEIQDNKLVVGADEPRDDVVSQIMRLAAVFPAVHGVSGSAYTGIAVGRDSDSMDRVAAELVRQRFPEPFQRLYRFAQTHADIVPTWMVDVAQQTECLAAWKSCIEGLSAQGLACCLPDVEAYDDIRPCDIPSGDIPSGVDHSFDDADDLRSGALGRMSSPREERADMLENVEGLFNLELALTKRGMTEHDMMGHGGAIVTSSYRLMGPERTMVITGANQGGKTTFACAVGQLHYFASLGLPVPASRALIRFTPLVLTAFAAEERFDAGRGKFEDDLMKMKAVTLRMVPGTLIVANEMFASTTSHDALLVSRRLLDTIRQRAGLCVWVTFLSELADPPAVSMVAQVSVEDGERRTFHMLRRPADGRAYAISLLSAHHLTSHEISERMHP